METQEEKFSILMIENNKGDVVLTELAMEIAGYKVATYSVDTVDKGLDFIFKKNQYQHMPTPKLILLDLNLPCMNGRELIRTVKQDKEYYDIPIIVLTTSASERDRRECFKLGADKFVIKSISFDEFSEKLRKILALYLPRPSTKLGENLIIKGPNEFKKYS